MMKKNSTLVYSTDPKQKIKTKDSVEKTQSDSDGIIRIYRETKGRKGAGVSIVRGFDLENAELKTLAKQLKRLCGTGGTIKEGAIEIQGDHREKIKAHLEQSGHQVKLAGG